MKQGNTLMAMMAGAMAVVGSGSIDIGIKLSKRADGAPSRSKSAAFTHGKKTKSLRSRSNRRKAKAKAKAKR